MSRRSRTKNYQLTWYGDENKSAIADAIAEGLADLMLEAELQAKARLYPSHGYDTGSMQRATHVAKKGYKWQNDHQPAGPGTPERGGVRVLPTSEGGSRMSIELGCGQDYTIFYHQKYDPFLMIAYESVHTPARMAAFIHPYLRAKGFVK